jgi:hypothetical protein
LSHRLEERQRHSPPGNGYTKIYSTTTAFAAIKTDGSIKVWGGSSHGDISAPSTGVYTKIYALETSTSVKRFSLEGCAFSVKEKIALSVLSEAFLAVTVYRVRVLISVGVPLMVQVALSILALKTDGSIKVWGNASAGGTGAPVGNGYTKIYSAQSAFVAIKANGSITAWGSSSVGGTTPAPNLTNTTGADQIVVIGSAITGITFHNSGGSIASCTVAPTLPAGLSIDSATCTISGTPTEVRALTLYTVTARNASDNTDWNKHP